MKKINNYFCIGNLHSAALVSKEAKIEWLCLPHFDSPSMFGQLLGEKNGVFSIQKREDENYQITSRYLPNTAITEFTFISPNNSFLLKDFMPVLAKKTCSSHFLVRKFTGLKNNSRIQLFFRPMPNYAKDSLPMNIGKNILSASVGKDTLILHLPKNCEVKQYNGGYQLTLNLAEGETKEVTLEYILNGSVSTLGEQDFEKQTTLFWHRWVKKGTFFNYHKSLIIRSAITLKLMQFYPTGAIVAAPTTSLPETVGGERNWDYRYVWIRDATFTLYAFFILGYVEEAEKFFEFINSIIETSTSKEFDIALMYTINGKHVPEETPLSHLQGFKHSQPVRIGNGAAEQFQLDIYGSLLDAYYFVSKKKLHVTRLHKKTILKLVDVIARNWNTVDNGIWEVRGGQKHYTYSKVMAWVGVNRALRMAKRLRLTDNEINKYKLLEKEIHDWIWRNCYDPVNRTFTQSSVVPYQDATNFLFVLLQFLDRHDHLTKDIIFQSQKELAYKDIFVYRYINDDGLKGKEGAFILCSFWLISSLAAIGEITQAEKLFEKMLKLIDKDGLLAEEINPHTGEYLGNFPQAFSHIGLIMSIYYLYRYSSPTADSSTASSIISNLKKSYKLLNSRFLGVMAVSLSVLFNPD